MLARLQKNPEVHLAEVEQTGRIFRVQLSSPLAASSLSSTYEELPPEEEPSHTRWFSLQNIAALSLLEASILAARWSAHAAQALSMNEAQQGTLKRELEDELARLFLRVHAKGDAAPGWHKAAFIEVIEQITQRMGSAELRDVLREVAGAPRLQE